MNAFDYKVCLSATKKVFRYFLEIAGLKEGPEYLGVTNLAK